MFGSLSCCSHGIETTQCWFETLQGTKTVILPADQISAFLARIICFYPRAYFHSLSGVILTKEVMAHLKVKKGDTLYLTEMNRTGFAGGSNS